MYYLLVPPTLDANTSQLTSSKVESKFVYR